MDVPGQKPVGEGDFLERIAQQVASRSGAQAVFAQPIERGGVTIVPVARVRHGFGGGSRSKGQGMGGGGGGAATPVGFIELRAGTAVFRSIPDRMASNVRTLARFAGASLALWLALREVRKLLER